MIHFTLPIGAAVAVRGSGHGVHHGDGGRGLHSSTYQINLCRFGH